MPGTLLVDPSTFQSAIVMAVAPKEVFGQPGVQDKNSAGVLKWQAAVAVSYVPDPAGGMTAQSEVLQITITSNTDPGANCPLGTQVTLDQLRVGLSPPEKRDNGSIRGGRLWFSAAGLRPTATTYRSSKSDAAA
jgi:hypothetical protein